MLWGGFMPPSDLRLSIFVVDGFSEADIHAHGVKYATRPGPPVRQPEAFGEFLMKAVAQQNLRVDRDDNPPRHAQVIGWPTEKSQQKLIALQLAAAVTNFCLSS
jgi:hypothetical protein